MPKRLFYILLIYILSQNVTAQIVDDSTSHKSASNMIDVYYQALGEQSPLYNGSEYIEYPFTFEEGHPFFGSPTWVNGNINFDGLTFHEVPMAYDIIKDQVVIKDFRKAFNIVLPSNKIEQFTISGHTFIRLLHDSSNQIKTGFYDQLYNGKIGLFVKREKKIYEKYLDLHTNNVAYERNTYYIRKEGIYYIIKNKRTLLNVLKNKKELQKYLRKNGLRFKNNTEKTMIMAVQYYDLATN
jgi:hypothetical protein